MHKNELRSFILLIIVSLVWGCSYFLIKKSLIHLSPLQVASARLAITSTFFLPFAIYYFRIEHLKKIFPLLTVGFCGSAIPAFLFAIAQTKMNSGLTGALTSLTPIFTLLIGIFFFSQAISYKRIAGVIIGFVGATLIILGKNSIDTISNPYYGLYIALASLCYAISSNVIGAYLSEMSSFSISSIGFGLTFLPSIYFVFSSGLWSGLLEGGIPINGIYSVAILALFGSILASIFYFWLIKESGAVFASTSSFITPVVAILIGSFDHEPVYFIHIFGTFVMLIGIILTRKRLVE